MTSIFGVMKKTGCVYLLSSPNRNTIYTGVTSNLKKRVWQHRNKYYPESFSAVYNCVILVYYQSFESIENAIIEEKRIKGGSRKQKEQLIESINPHWKDLWYEIENW